LSLGGIGFKEAAKIVLLEAVNMECWDSLVQTANAIEDIATNKKRTKGDILSRVEIEIGAKYIDEKGFVVSVEGIDRTIFEDKVITDKYVYGKEYFLSVFKKVEGVKNDR